MIGSWNEGKLNGKGFRRSKNGDEKQYGNFVNNEMDGKGLIVK